MAVAVAVARSGVESQITGPAMAAAAEEEERVQVPVVKVAMWEGASIVLSMHTIPQATLNGNTLFQLR